MTPDLVSGDEINLQGAYSTDAICSVAINQITDNSITFETYVGGSNWSGKTGYIFKIIGRKTT